MPDDDRHPDGDDAEREDRAEEEASEAEAQPDAEGDAGETEASEAEAAGDAEGDAAEREAAEAEAAETEGDEAERRAAEEEVRAAEEEGDDFGINQKRMPFTQHLVELRFRILVCLGTVAAAFIILFLTLSPYLYEALTLPVLRACEMAGVDFDKLLVSRKPTEMFVTAALMCLLAAVVLTIPVTVHQVWEFIAPGLKRKERKAVVPVLSIGSGLFILGAVFAYLLVAPVALQFLMSYTLRYKGIKLLWNIGDTLKFEIVLMLVFGVAFELPLVVTALTRVGIISPQMVARRRRHLIVGMFLIGALLTPPDVVTQLCLALPLVILLEISIQVSKLFKPRHTIWEAWDADEDVLGKEWDEAVAATSAAASGTGESPSATASGAEPDGSEDYGYEEYYGDGEYYDDEYGEYGEYGEYDEGDDYKDSMGDDIDYDEEDEDTGPAEPFPDEDAPPEDDEQGGGEPGGDETPDEPTSPAG